MDTVALVVALIALAISLVSLFLSIISRDIFRILLDNRNLERPSAQITPGTYSGEQGITTRTVNAPKRDNASAFLDVPALSPEDTAPLLGHPPMSKGGFGTRVSK
jgi:hypothetical protein